MLKGIIANSGYAIGKILKIDQQTIDTSKVTIKNIENEISYLHEAIEKTVVQLEHLKKINAKKFDAETLAIFDAHITIARDPEVISQVEDKIKSESCNLTYAIRFVVDSILELFKDIQDEYIRQRASDLLEVSDRIIKNHLNIQMIDIQNIEHKVILAAHEITASEAAQINPKYILGIISEAGGKNSHSSIIARLLGIPALVGVDNLMDTVNDKDQIILDAVDGKLIRSYTKETLLQYKDKYFSFQLEKQKLKSIKTVRSITTDGIEVELLANIGSSKDLTQALDQNAYGVGLFRTEVLFLDRYEFPSEEEQFLEYKKVLESFKDKPVIIRTLDVGGDKLLPYLKLPAESNPALGNRGARLSLSHLDIFKIQIRALLRASHYGYLKVMFPMISTKDEFMKLQKIVHQVEKEFKENKILYKPFELGIMIEIPSAAIIADQLASVCDFFSIGTNDLIQYTFAADRLNANLDYLNQPFHPSILRLIHMVTKAAKAHGKKTSVCGEMASDPLGACLLIGLGVDELSMTSSLIPGVKNKILQHNHKQLVLLAEKLLDAQNEKEVLKTLQKKM
ncbi:phosphoenolpyruvate--protein phosphotransferase [Mariniplasma anaerobium]|uniref:Phosphoenolpyruvate-protein phosphotransferase n=1 Tax=Mariniplasma anaerobium TaxID=2735436 RepID=A0A7U9TIZ3_9MOLU|nr:phosphoenolpyruvate--protein phosphotransferase [Mariniplasma anaerobium]BCR35607.1 phosphoenolpyruvate-protein phosphotransferase [Mariniplasma anaerobium]